MLNLLLPPRPWDELLAHRGGARTSFLAAGLVIVRVVQLALHRV